MSSKAQKILGGEMYWRESKNQTNTLDSRDTLELILYSKNVLLESQWEVVYFYGVSNGIFYGGATLIRTLDEYELKNENNVCTSQNGIKVFRQSYKGLMVPVGGNFLDTKGTEIVFDRYLRDNLLSNINGAGTESFSLVTQIKKFEGIDLISPSLQPKPTENFMVCKGKEFKIDASTFNQDDYEIKYSIGQPVKGYTKLNAEDGISFNFKPKLSYLNWAKGYSKKKPFGKGSSLKINPKTGLITGKSNENGIFGFSIRFEQVDKKGKVIGFATKEMFIMSYDCPTKTNLIKPQILKNGQIIKNVDICPGEKITFNVPLDNSINYQWKKDKIAIPFQNQETLTISEEGNYSIIISSRDNCMLPSESESVNVTVKPITPIINSKDGDEIFFRDCAGIDIKLTLKNNINNYDVEWSEVRYLKDSILQVSKEFLIKSFPIGAIQVYAKYLNTGCGTSPKSNAVVVYSLPPGKLNFPTSNWKKDTIIYICPYNDHFFEIPEFFDFDLPKYTLFLNDEPINYVLGNKFLFEGKYYFKIGYEGCTEVTNNFYVKFDDDCFVKKNGIFLPNIFSPNNDGLNDSLDLFNIVNFPELEILIYDRWGKLIFYNKGYTEKFDGTFEGKPLPEGFYSYRLIYNDGYLDDMLGSLELRR
jgi:gliding motility-associated-like protein